MKKHTLCAIGAEGKRLTRPIARVACVALLSFLALACTRDRAERERVAQFGARRAILDTLKAMSDADTAYARIAEHFIDRNVPPMSVARWDRYRELFRRVHSSGGLLRRYDGSVLIFDGESGVFGAGAEYSYVFFPTAPSAAEVLERLSGAPPGSRFYRRLEGNWYLEQDR